MEQLQPHACILRCTLSIAKLMSFNSEVQIKLGNKSMVTRYISLGELAGATNVSPEKKTRIALSYVPTR